MSSLNSNNEFEELDNPFEESNLASEAFQEGMPAESETDVPEGEPLNFDAASEPDAENPDFQTEGENPEVEETDESALSEEEAAPVQYKKARCWDMYSWLLFIAWIALLGAILFLWLECPPTEYGYPPYRENSVPVKPAQ